MKQRDLFCSIKERTKIQQMFSFTKRASKKRRDKPSTKENLQNSRVFHSHFFICTVFPNSSRLLFPVKILWTLSSKKENSVERNQKKRQWKSIVFSILKEEFLKYNVQSIPTSSGLDVIFFIKSGTKMACYQDKKKTFQKTWHDIISYLEKLK